MAVYLIHLDTPYYHAQHYLGATYDVERRISEHRACTSKSSPLLVAASRAGIQSRVVRLWRGGFWLESRLKRRKNNHRLCPIWRAGGAVAEDQPSTEPMAAD